MRLYLVQHGEAKPEAEDPERSLTIRGEEETEKISDSAKRLGIRPSRIAALILGSDQGEH